MTLRELADLLKAEILGGHPNLDTEIEQVIGSDMMSDILSTPCGDRAVLLTSLTNLQVIRTAEIIDVKAVVFVTGHYPRSEAISLASKAGLPVLLTNYSLVETRAVLHQAGLKV